MRASLTYTLVGLSVWLLCLTAAILGKRYLEKNGKRTYSWLPVLAFVALSAIALLVAGSMYRSAHLHSSGAATNGPRAEPQGPQGPQGPAERAQEPPSRPAPGTSETSSQFDFEGM